jgi:putative peptide zinc metalloprotease protein
MIRRGPPASPLQANGLSTPVPQLDGAQTGSAESPGAQSGTNRATGDGSPQDAASGVSASTASRGAAGATAIGNPPASTPKHADPGSAGSPAEHSAGAPVPERPQVAPGVQLSGMMGEGGFKDQQWLVERNGRFLQLTELLYRVLEQANGQQATAEIGAKVAEQTGRKLSADNVDQLVARKLIPLGLVVQADGSVAATPEGSGGAARSLGVNLKMARISPAVINPLTSVLQGLFWPPVLVACVLAGMYGEWWLFFQHGVAGGMHDVLTQPGLLLAALGLIFVAAAFHELGHAAALRYGGGEVRGMGAGIYLVYPVFYTDVSDNYRLGRWSRVRTDLAGFYFNLLFALGLMGLCFLTHSQFLLLVVLLIDFDIVRQLLPFVRLDGYWALADVTGIPDFFSQMGPFLRTVLPIPGWKGRKLPNLKTWVKVVFALYILITVPLLLLLMLAMVKSVPRVIATAGLSYAKLFGGLVTAGSVLGVAAGIVQIIALTLPTIGMFFILYTLTKSLFGGLWRWGAASPVRRSASVVLSLAIVAFIGLLWLPQIPSLIPGIGGRTNPAYARDAFRPIAPYERGTVGDAISSAPLVGPHLTFGATSVDQASPAQPLRRAIASPTPVPSVSAVPGARIASTPTASVSPRPGTPTPTATPATTPSPTLQAATPAAGTSRPPTAVATTVSVPGSAGNINGNVAPVEAPISTAAATPEATTAPVPNDRVAPVTPAALGNGAVAQATPALAPTSSILPTSVSGTAIPTTLTPTPALR